MGLVDQTPALVVLIVGLALLVGGGEWLVRGAAAWALRANIPPLIIGLTAVSLGTSAPELFASIQAALEGHPGIAVGNVLGSNIANVALILGLTAMVRPLRVDRMALKIDIPLMLGASFLFVAVAANLKVNRGEGIGGLVLLALFIVNLFKRARREDGQGNNSEEMQNAGAWAKRSPLILLLLITAGTAGLYIGSELFVEGASRIALDFGVGDRVVGLTVVAFGTSVPELVASGIAALRGQPDLAVGNIIGSNLFNLLLVLGATATISPLTISSEVLSWDIWWFLGTSAAIIPLAILSSTQNPKLGRWQGALFVAAYILYIGTTWTSA